MAISETQIAKIIYRETISAYREGVSPDLTRTANLIKELASSQGGLPTLSIREQGRKKAFNVEAFNNFMKEVEFDLEVVYEELQNLIIASTKRLNLNDITYRAQRQQLEEVIGMLDNLLFARINADGRFFGLFDTFESLTKVDSGLSTYGAVDLNEGAVQLPFSALGVKKIDLSHLYETNSWPIGIPGRTDIISSNPGINAGFGNAFTDIHNVWRQDIKTNKQGPITIECRFPITNTIPTKKAINRVQLIPHTAGKMLAELFYSSDGINVTKILTSPNVVLDRQGQATNLDFETLEVEEIILRLTKTEPDEALEDGTFLYLFGLAHIGLFSTGRSLKAELISTPQKPEGMTGKINMISLRAIEERPAETNIKYFVAVSDSVGEIEGGWISIQPVGRESTGAPSTISLGSNATRYIAQTPADASPTETVRSIDYFTLPTPTVADDDIVYGSSRLRRGGNVWSRNKRKETQLKQNKDSYISFNSGDIQKIYAVSTETASHRLAISTLAASTGPEVSHLTLTNLLDWNDATMPLIPPNGVDIEVDQRPNYSVYRVLRFRSEMNISNEPVVLTEEISVDLSQTNVNISLSESPVVTDSPTPTVTYVEGVDYIMEQGFDNLPTGAISRIATGAIANGGTVYVSYSLNPDITHLVDGANNNEIFLSTDLTTNADDRFEVTYRWVPTGDNNAVRSTIKVTSKYGDTDEGVVFQEGPDYTVDTISGTITRVPAGNILPSSNGDVAIYVDFYYKTTPPQVETHSAWVYYPDRDPRKIIWSSLAIDETAGESLLLVSPEWTVDLSNKTETPELSKGWYQVIVKTKDPDIFNSTNSSCAIRNVIQMQDIEGDYIFLSGGKYFSELKAFREPLRHVTKEFLQYSTIAGDHSTFALDENRFPIINFDPFNTDDVFRLKVVTTNGTTFTTTETDPENFILEYAYRVGQTTTGEFILLKAILSRGVASDPGLTPKLRRYDLRVS